MKRRRLSKSVFEPQNDSYLYNLPQELLVEIISLLEVTELWRFGGICRKFAFILSEYWKKIYERDFGIEIKKLHPYFGISYAQRYLRILALKDLKGKRLEARDLKYPSLICVATVDDLRLPTNERPIPQVLITFDGWTREYGKLLITQIIDFKIFCEI